MRKEKPKDNPQRQEITYDELEEVPIFQQPENLNHSISTRKNTMKDFMNAPMVPYIIKALDEGIEMIAGYNESLDRIIDFIAGFSAKSDDGYDYGQYGKEEEGSVGKTIESGLVRLLTKIEIPQKIIKMNEKAGILSHPQE